VAERSKYTDDDRARVYLALSVNEGNVKRSSRDTGVPISTVRLWKKTWEKDGVSQDIQTIAEAQAQVFIQDASRARDLALAQWTAKVEAGEVAARDLMTGIGVLTDKINMAKGLTRNTGPSQPAVDPAAMRELARGLIAGALDAARERESVVEDVEYERVVPRAIEEGTRA